MKSSTLTNLLQLLTIPPTLAQTTTIIPSSTNYILTQSQTGLLTAQSGGLLSITSDIPVSISRYNDNRYADGEQPIFPTDAVVLVTSDCDTDVIPTISWDYSTGGAVTIEAGANSVENFIEPASYAVMWKWRNWGCDVYPTPAPFSSSVFSLGPTDAGQVVSIQEGGETQTLDEFQQEGEKKEEKDGTPFSEEEYKSSPSAAGRVSLYLGAVLVGMAMTENTRWMVLGKVGVAALSLSPVLSGFGFGGGANKNKFKGPASNRNDAARSLQTCTYNAEVLIDGCTHPLVINAPSVRIVEAVVVNSNSQKGTEEPCLYEYSADITFPTDSGVTSFDNDGTTVEVDALSYSECIRPTDGRPFVDVSGNSLLARPVVATGSESCIFAGVLNAGEWSGPNQPTNESYNVTTYNEARLLLGQEWTQRALGEHASVASFSAFSIALMTNAAPSSLVEASLKAGLDEVRHARVSFEIASHLLGKKVEPSALPESKHEFGRDLIGLALAVAREGCVDETLSALAAAAEVEAIESYLTEVRGEGGTSSTSLNNNNYAKYSNVQPATLHWIRDELKTISLDESNHSALAWRTLRWVCSIDSDACDAVKNEVFHSYHMDKRFQRRSEGSPGLASMMKTEWQNMYESFNMSLSNKSVCSPEIEIDEPLVTEVSERVMKAILC